MNTEKDKMTQEKLTSLKDKQANPKIRESIEEKQKYINKPVKK